MSCPLLKTEGIGSKYASKLNAIGVDTLDELRNCKRGNPRAKMADVNAAGKLVRVLPSPNKVVGWVERAEALSPVAKYQERISFLRKSR